MTRTQLDMFDNEDELFDAAPPVFRADPERVRVRLNSMLDEVRNAGAHGLEHSRRRLLETVVPQMTLWLPEAEAEQIRLEFNEALKQAA